MFALVIAEKTTWKKPEVFFCAVDHETIDEFVASVGDRLNINYQSRVAVVCDGVGPISAYTKIDAIQQDMFGVNELKFFVKFAKSSSREGIFYAPKNLKSKKCRTSPRFSHKYKTFDSPKMKTGSYVHCR